MASSRRPEHCAPPELFYSEREALKYTGNSRVMAVQRTMSERAVELLALDSAGSGTGGARLLLDLGCGSALSGQVLSALGHMWLGIDISPAMLDVANQRRLHTDDDMGEEEDDDDDEQGEDEGESGGQLRGCGDLLLGDLGAGVPLRPGCCDGAVSVSALQWLCQADHTHHQPARRLAALFTSLYACLSRGARAVFQFYPESSAHVEMVTVQAMRAGFTGGLVVDFPNSSKAKKVFLVLMTGGKQPLPPAMGSTGAVDSVPTSVMFTRRERQRRARERPSKHSRSWILKKKERRRKQGLEVVRDSKYTGRKRKVGF